MQKLNLNEKLKQFSDYWNPRIVSELNGQHVKIAKIYGEFVWHSHENEDELFMVVKGSLDIELINKTVRLQQGEFYIVPKGVLHKPIAKEEVHLLLFEPLSTKHTGDIISDITLETYESI